MIYKTLIALALVLGLVQGQAKLQLLGTLRDFANIDSGLPEAHPDFNSFLGSEKNIVKDMLGFDTKPIFNVATKVTSEATFNQWYRDNAKNKAFDYTLELTDVNNNGIYTYENSEFFPLDGKGFGNEKYEHNYGFTFEVHTSFTYKKGQEFYFRGDDDLWVFINKKLVIDLGGSHNAEEASVKLDTLGLTEGLNYNLDIFFAERHTYASNFKIQTSIELKPSCSAPQIYNPAKNACEDCVLPKVYLTATGTCGSCTAPQVYNIKTFACEDCPAPKVYNPKSMMCEECPAPTVYNPKSMMCENCVAPQVYNPKSKMCEDCPAPTVYNPKSMMCEECPAPTVYNPKSKMCENCVAPQVYNPKSKMCEDCPAPKVYNPKSKTCEDCVAPQLYLAATKTCGTCPAPKVYDPKDYTCENCPYPEYFNFDGTCIPDCPKMLADKQDGVPICHYPCRKTQIYQVAKEKCRCDCPSPSTKKEVNGYKICV